MRQVLSLSLPEKTAKAVRNMSARRGFKSVSGYIRHLIDMDKEVISEAELMKSVKTARREYREGKTRTAESLRDFI